MIWRCWFVNGLPELIALLKVYALGQPLAEVLVSAQLIRQAWIGAEVIHGLGHSLARAVVDQDAAAISLENLLEHRSMGQMAQGLIPLAPMSQPPGVGPPIAWMDAGDPEPWKLRLKAGGALFLHGLVCAWAGIAFLRLQQSGAAGTWGGDLLLWLLLTNLWLAITSRSDLETLLSGQGALLFCDNFGLLASREHAGRGELLSPRALEIFEQMGRDTELRGAQAGGGLVMALDRRGDNGFVGHKIVNAKRGDLTPSLEAAFRSQRRRARRNGWKPHPAGLMACWHYRFGTSGPPAVRETHWQEWTPGRHAHLWRLDGDGQWRQHWRRVHHRITHNGDFEAFSGFGRLVDVGTTLAPWLEEALEQPAPAVVDSSRIAGMMALMICQGDWFAAVRWAFLHTLATFPNTPARTDIERWTAHFEAAFSDLLQTDPRPEDLTAPMTRRLLSTLQSESGLKALGEGALRRWIATSIEVFLHNDPATAVRQFMEGARGSFGLVVASTTWPDRLVLCSLGQPITIGLDPNADMAVYASESAAVDTVLKDKEGAWRIDLDENAGEIAVLSSNALSITSLSQERKLEPAELHPRRQPYGTQRRTPSSPYVLRLPTAPADPVSADIAAIPALLATIHDDWSNPGSRNRQAAEAFAQLLIAKAANLADKAKVLKGAGLDDSLAKSRQVDLLITGVENSLWLGQQFGKDLSTLMPQLSVQVLSANEVLKALQNDIDSLHLARQSIALVLSHSGRTFPSRQVMEACDLMARREVIRDVFILTGEPDSLQGAAMLKPHPGEPFSRRLFTTGAGRRRAEPATASVAAMHHTLTQLLFNLSRQVLQAFPDDRDPPLGMPLSREQLKLLDTSETEALLREIRDIVGVDKQGQPQPTATHRHLVRGGRRWAMHVLETPLAWAIHAIYILITLELRMPLVQTLMRNLAGENLWTASTLPAILLRESALVADVAVYIFGPWLWTIALRWLQRRPLLARTGRRTLVIGEASWIHPLLTNYISKLFALSFGIASVDVQGGEVGDHLLHTHAHRLVRGTLLFFGVPDGRGNGLSRADADAALLTARQSDGIRHWNTGPEIVAIGTDPTLATGPFEQVFVLPCGTAGGTHEDHVGETDQLIENLRESRFVTFRRLLASYVFFWAMARDVGLLPGLRFKWWRSQSRTRVMTTAAPVSAAQLDLAEEEEIAALSLDNAGREQS